MATFGAFFPYATISLPISYTGTPGGSNTLNQIVPSDEIWIVSPNMKTSFSGFTTNNYDYSCSNGTDTASISMVEGSGFLIPVPNNLSHIVVNSGGTLTYTISRGSYGYPVYADFTVIKYKRSL